MSRAQRLLDLIQALRGYRRPVSGATLAEALGISLRTVYRDIETLKAQGLAELMFLESTPEHQGNLLIPSSSLVGVYRWLRVLRSRLIQGGMQ